MSLIVVIFVLFCCPLCTLSDRIRSNAIASSSPSDDEQSSSAVSAKNSVLKGQILEEDEEKLDVERRKRERLARSANSGFNTRVGAPVESSPSSVSTSSSSSSTPETSSSLSSATAAALEPQYDPFTNNFLILLRTRDGKRSLSRIVRKCIYYSPINAYINTTFLYYYSPPY